MLDGILKSREQKTLEKIELLISQGLSLVEEKFYKKAMISFNEALGLDRDLVYDRLVKELDNFSRSGNSEGALSVGLNLLKENESDTKLATQLGNFARQIEDYKQAEDLYRHALKVDPEYDIALYNLAASLAKVNKFDEQVIQAISKFDRMTDFVLPEYESDPEIIDKISEIVLEKKRIRIDEKLQELMLEHEEKIVSNIKGDAVDALELEISKLKNSKVEVEPADIYAYISQMLKEKKINGDKDGYFTYIYNQGLYALNVGDVDKAGQSFLFLKKQGAKFSFLHMNLAIANAKKGNLKEGIKVMVHLLGSNRYSRFYNVNLGLMYRKSEDRLLSYKYLVLGAWLLEQSEGIYRRSELIALADKKVEDGRFKDAIKLYNVVVFETDDANIWFKIGNIHLEKEKFEEALEAYRKVLASNPKHEGANLKLAEIYRYYFDKAQGLLNEGKFKPAADNFQSALDVIYNGEVLKKIILVYKLMKNSEREQFFNEKLKDLEEKEKEKEQEITRQKKIKAAKGYMMQKNYRLAIGCLEDALRLKVDKNIFLQLASMYKGLKKFDDLHDLLNRWNKMVEHEEKMKKFKKEEDRKKVAEENE